MAQRQHVQLTQLFLQAVNLAQEFVIKSSSIEDKINQLLPSQGGFQAGVDISASTMVVPIVDLTETAEGSQVRQDLQTAFSLNDITSFDVSATTSTLISTTGYYRVFGMMAGLNPSSGSDHNASFQLTDGVTTKEIIDYVLSPNSNNVLQTINYDFTVFLPAGQSLTATTNASGVHLVGNTKQIADINGNLTTPS